LRGPLRIACQWWFETKHRQRGESKKGGLNGGEKVTEGRLVHKVFSRGEGGRFASLPLLPPCNSSISEGSRKIGGPKKSAVDLKAREVRGIAVSFFELKRKYALPYTQTRMRNTHLP